MTTLATCVQLPKDLDDIVAAIQKDHDDLRKFIEVMKDEESHVSELQEALSEFSALLKSYLSAKEQILYERCLKVEELRRWAQEGFVQHEVAGALLKSVKKMKDEEHWLNQVRLLAEKIERHLDYEESGLLRYVEKSFDPDRKSKMAEEFVALRKQTQKRVSEENAGVLEDLLH